MYLLVREYSIVITVTVVVTVAVVVVVKYTNYKPIQALDHFSLEPYAAPAAPPPPPVRSPIRYRTVEKIYTLHTISEQASTFPKLAALARTVLAVPATSAPSERVFSALSSTQRDHHRPPSRANKIIFVHENDRFVAALKDD